MTHTQDQTSAGPPLAEEARYAAAPESATCPKCNGFGYDVDPPNDRPWIHWPCGKCKGSGRITLTVRGRGRPRKSDRQPHNSSISPAQQ